jgi:hypothetical protein
MTHIIETCETHLRYLHALEDALNAYDAALLMAALFNDKVAAVNYRELAETHKEARSKAIEAARRRIPDGDETSR